MHLLRGSMRSSLLSGFKYLMNGRCKCWCLELNRGLTSLNSRSTLSISAILEVIQRWKCFGQLLRKNSMKKNKVNFSNLWPPVQDSRLWDFRTYNLRSQFLWWIATVLMKNYLLLVLVSMYWDCLDTQMQK